MNDLTYRKGMTLIELMIVVAVLAIIGALALPAYTGYIKSGKMSECQNEVSAIKVAEEEYFLANNTYFSGNNVIDLQNNSDGLYNPTPEALGVNRPANCTYTVAVGGGGNTYTITATGAGDLAGEGTIVSYSN